MKQYEMFELQFQGPEPEGAETDSLLQAVFTCGKMTWCIQGFYAGNRQYKIRFLPTLTGVYLWEVTGIVQAKGKETCTKSEHSHGLVRAEGTHFRYQDGTRYLPFGTTIYALFHQTPELIEETLTTLPAAPFNKVRLCLFPKHYLYNHNDPQFFPFRRNMDGTWDVKRPCMEYWDHLEEIMKKLSDMGIEADLILFHSYDCWGFSTLQMEEWKCFLDYAVRRLAAFPNLWWSLANEYDLLFNRTLEDWHVLEEQIAEQDPYHHLLSCHNGFHFYDFTRPDITHCSVQTDALYKAAEWQRRYQKPVIYDECCYEGNIGMNWGNISAFEMVHRFWCGVVSGAYVTHGETYLSDDDVLWWAKGGKLKGKSPARIAFLKKLAEGLPEALSPWEEPFDLDLTEINMTAEGQEHPGDLFIHLLNSGTEEERELQAAKNAAYTGHCGDEVFIKYYGRQCPAAGTILLPKDQTYSLEIIDIWEMTITPYRNGISGKQLLSLPGKEGIAVIARKIS